MNTKKFISSMLVLTMALGITSCSNNTKKYAKGLEEVDFVEYDYSEAKKFKKTEKYEDEYETGFYSVITDEKDIKKFLKNNTDDLDSDDVSSVLYGQKLIIDKDRDTAVFTIYVMDMKDKDTAEDLFEDVDDEFDDMYSDDSDFEFDNDDNYSIATCVYKQGDKKGYDYNAVYLDGKTVIYITSYGSGKPGKELTDLIDEYCENMGLQAPGDI